MTFGFRKPKAIAPDVQLPGSTPDSHGHPQNCLNCETALVGNYCHQCGQSAHTHRMSFKHFLLHDFVHGVWHLDKGFPATLKKAFVRPGEEIRSYLAGRRVGWFSILTMILLLYAVINYLTPDSDYTGETEQSKIVFEFISHYSKWLLLALAFVCSWSSYLIFRRSKLNLSEHTIVNCFFLVGILAINAIYSAIPFELDGWLTIIIFIIVIAYLFYAYYGAFRRHYTLAGWSWRMLIHCVLSVLILFTFVLISIKIYMNVTGSEKLIFGIHPKASDTTSHHVPAAP